MIKWYPADESLKRTAGNRVGVQINAPEGFEGYEYVTVTIGETVYDWNTIQDGEGFFKWYPLVTAEKKTFTAIVKWNEASEQEFTVVIDEGLKLEAAPVEEVAGSIARADSTGGALEVKVEGDTITFEASDSNDVIKWYPADESLGRTAGNRVGVQINAPEGFEGYEYVTVTIGETVYDWNTIQDGEGFFKWYPLVTAEKKTFTAIVKWNEASEQEFTVVIDEGLKLEAAPVEEVAGSIARADSTGGALEVKVEGDTITFEASDSNDVIKWYPADESLGRTAGNRVGVQINAPEGFEGYEYVTVTIGETVYDWNTIQDGEGFFKWYPLVTAEKKTFTAIVKWNEASEQEFTVVIDEGLKLEAAPALDTIGDDDLVINADDSRLGGFAAPTEGEEASAIKVSDLVGKFNPPAGFSVVVKNSEGEPVEPDALIATGMVVQLHDSEGNVIDELTVIVTGDLTGTGLARVNDFALMAYYLVGDGSLSNNALAASDFNADDDVSVNDFALFAEYLLGS